MTVLVDEQLREQIATLARANERSVGAEVRVAMQMPVSEPRHLAPPWSPLSPPRQNSDVRAKQVDRILKSLGR